MLAPEQQVEPRLEPQIAAMVESRDRKRTLRGLRVLVVDDEFDARALVTAMLERSGAQVLAVGSTREALDSMQTWKPDVLIADIGMPVEDGYGLIRKVRALPSDQGGQTPALALTAYARTEDRIRALSEGYQVHLAKPVDRLELATIVGNLRPVRQNGS
jgi:CheY-like chemotaxis protein